MSNIDENPPSDPFRFESYFELPRAYTLAYEWGHFAVSKAADLDYGFVPLTEGVIRDNSEVPPLPNRAVEIVLLGSSERMPSIDFDNVPWKPGATTRALIVPKVNTDKTLQIAVGYERTAAEMLDAELDKLAAQMDFPVNSLKECLEEETKIPVVEYLANKIPDTLVHTLTASLAGVLANSLPYQRKTKFGRTRDQLLGTSILKALSITRDVHDSFCKHYFEQQFQLSLNEDIQ